MTKKKLLQIHTEAEVMTTFNLNKLDDCSPLLNDWLKAETILSDFYQMLLNQSLERAKKNISFWSEEDLKMYFISDIIKIAEFVPSKKITTCFDKKMESEVGDYTLNCKPDFTMAKGRMDLIERPYFHFHEYKKDKASTRDPLGQLLKAFLIGATINANNKPIYGAYIIGRFWYFVVYENNETLDYSVSPSYDSTKENELIQIIAILRHFKVILETTLLD